MWFSGFRSYVPVAKRREQAAKEAAKLRRKGQQLSPIIIEGRKITSSFWGKAWCDNLESYSDFDNRLPRGRSYARNGSIIDLKIDKGVIHALVSGSDLYEVRINIAPLPKQRWKLICRDCAGTISSLVELLRGKLSTNVMERVSRKKDGMFPSPKEISMSCTCPDRAGMCKHLAATLYGVGNRLDSAPEVLFQLRGVNQSDMISASDAVLPRRSSSKSSDRIMSNGELSALFGLDIAGDASSIDDTHRALSRSARKERQIVAAPGKDHRMVTESRKTKTAETGRTVVEASVGTTRKSKEKLIVAIKKAIKKKSGVSEKLKEDPTQKRTKSSAAKSGRKKQSKTSSFD